MFKFYIMAENDSSIAHAWIHGNKIPSGYTNIFVDGDTIYSYGHHFPIARKDGHYVYFTLQTYSNTTAQHIWKVKSAVSHKTIIYCYEVPRHNGKSCSAHNQNIDAWIKEINKCVERLAVARKASKWIDEINVHRGRANTYIEHFKLDINHEQRRVLTIDPMVLITQEMRDKLAKERELERIKRKDREGYIARFIEAWRKCEENIYMEEHKDWSLSSVLANLPAIRLRIFGNDIRTSKDVKIPIDVAHRYYKIYLREVANGGCFNCEFKMAGFRVTTITDKHLVVGCHNIPREEIDLIAKQQGWNEEFAGIELTNEEKL